MQWRAICGEDACQCFSTSQLDHKNYGTAFFLPIAFAFHYMYFPNVYCIFWSLLLKLSIISSIAYRLAKASAIISAKKNDLKFLMISYIPASAHTNQAYIFTRNGLLVEYCYILLCISFRTLVSTAAFFRPFKAI